MKYSGSSIVTTHQVGASRVVIENDIPRNVTIQSTESRKIGSDSVMVFYYTIEFPGRRFSESEVFVDEAAAKTYFNSLDAV
jgi:hypothetical protein